MFYLIGIDIYHTVLHENDGEWIVPYNKVGEPQFVKYDFLLKCEKIEIPADFIKNQEKNNMTEVQKNKKKIIEPLLLDSECIKSRKKRNEIAKIQEINTGIKKRTILSLYFTYLSRGTLYKNIKKKKRADADTENFTKAINQYYYSAKKMSLRTAYDLMLLEYYTDNNGNLIETLPSWTRFKHFYYDNRYHFSEQKDISRNGLTNYKQTKRPLYGSAYAWKKAVGYYQMDATLADIYLVSRFSKDTVIGRPYIYMAVDTLTGLIAGIYVGLNCNESAVINCLVNAAEDKVMFCKKYDIEITEEQWPSKGLPAGIITDQGKEFIGKRTEELCFKYGMEIESLPPFRPDEKSLVEKTFDILQEKYKPFLTGKGIIEPDSQERWSIDYRQQAELNLDEFTKIIIRCILYMNTSRMLEETFCM